MYGSSNIHSFEDIDISFLVT